MAETTRRAASAAARALGSIRSPRKTESSRRNAALGGVIGGRPPREPYATRLMGTPYGRDGEAGPDVATLRQADTVARQALNRGQRLEVLRGDTLIAIWACGPDGMIARV